MNKILIANRGEIALRIMRTAKKMGIQTVAVFSEADRDAPFVRFADEAVCIGEAPSSKSYLKAKTIIKVAKELGVDGIHPGYGFLSENASFARAVKRAGITFIGPSPKSIKIMGSKLEAKAAVKKYDVPMVPGTDGAVTDIKEAKKVAKQIGFPILVKASAGGGGKGMRMVEELKELESQMKRAISEAESSFGDGSVFIEKFVTSPRHIEIQILADQHGNTLYLFERECSIQRRHQKVVEEAPSAVLTPELRQRMGEVAVKVAQSCDYEGAGTVEFLLDDKHNFYFLEMNTRLQVEHPVTEEITGIDLVEQQIRVARGEELSFKQDDLTINGHSFELRVYAEDPANNFLPSIGTLERYRPPHQDFVRLDDGFEEGMKIPIYYDPMIAKLVVHGANREEARQRMLEAIRSFEIKGIETTLPFGEYVLEHPNFISGDFDTNFIKHHFSKEIFENKDADEMQVAAKIALKAFLEAKDNLQTISTESANWQAR